MTLVRYHLPCPLDGCGSSDAYAEDDNGGGYCFSCGRTVFADGHTHTHQHTERRVMTATPIELPVLTANGIKSRGISAETMRKFGVGTDEDKNLWLPLYHEGQVIGAKVRSGKKEFKWHSAPENKDSVQLWGMQAAQAKWKLIITEGELDALAAYQMFEGKASVVSVPFGAQTAAKYVKKALQWVESFEAVYIAMDMDEPGRKASKELMDLLTPGKAREVVLPSGYKDACDLSAAGEARIFKEAIYSAQPRIIEGVLNTPNLIEETVKLYSTAELRVGVSTGYAGMDNLLGGYRQGEVLLVAGGTGSGKSTTARQLAYNLLKAQAGKLMYIPLEDQPSFSMLSLAQLHLQQDLIHDTPGELSITPEQLRNALLEVTQDLVVFTRDNINSLDKFMANLEFAIRTHDVRFVFLDHITLLAEGAEEATVAATNKLMGQIRYLANTYHTTFIVVSHISRNSSDPHDENPTMARLKNASSLGQVPDAVLGVFRQRGTTKTVIKTLKASRTWNRYGSVELQYDYDTTHLQEVEDFSYADDDTETYKEEDDYGTLQRPTKREEIQEQTGSGDVQGEQSEVNTSAVRSDTTPPDNTDKVHSRHSSAARTRRTSTRRNKGLPAGDRQDETTGSEGATPGQTNMSSVSDQRDGTEHEEEEFRVGGAAWVPSSGAAFYQTTADPLA